MVVSATGVEPVLRCQIQVLFELSIPSCVFHFSGVMIHTVDVCFIVLIVMEVQLGVAMQPCRTCAARLQLRDDSHRATRLAVGLASRCTKKSPRPSLKRFPTRVLIGFGVGMWGCGMTYGLRIKHANEDQSTAPTPAPKPSDNTCHETISVL